MDQRVLDELWAGNPDGDFESFIEANIGFTFDAETGARRPACLGSGDGQKYCWRCLYQRHC
jgi:hypothetical protein